MLKRAAADDDAAGGEGGASSSSAAGAGGASLAFPFPAFRLSPIVGFVGSFVKLGQHDLVRARFCILNYTTCLWRHRVPAERSLEILLPSLETKQKLGLASSLLDVHGNRARDV